MLEQKENNIRDLTTLEDGLIFAEKDIEFINRSLRDAGLEEISQEGLVLDLGCGEGSFVKGLKTAGYCAFGLDKSPALNLGEEEFIQADLNNTGEVLLKLENMDLKGKFDLVTANALSDYVAGEIGNIQPGSMAKVIAVSLKKDGVFYAPEVTLSILGKRSLIEPLQENGIVQLKKDGKKEVIFVKK